MERCTSLNVDVKRVAGRSPSPTRRKGRGRRSCAIQSELLAFG